MNTNAFKVIGCDMRGVYSRFYRDKMDFQATGVPLIVTFQPILLENGTFWVICSIEKSDQRKIFFPTMYYMLHFIQEIISAN